MLKKILEALGALLHDDPVSNRLIEQMKAWGDTQQEARHRLVSILSNVVASFERAHAITLIELSRLAAAKTPEDYNRIISEDFDRDKFYVLFKSNEICEHVHQLRADLKSGFGDIKESIVLNAAKELARSLGDFEQGEYTLAQQYQQYLSKVLFSAFTVNNQEKLREAISQIIDEQARLSEELAELTKFKQRLFQVSLYG